MAGIPESVATNIVQRLVDRAIDEAYYLCYFKKIAEHFEEEKKTLEAKRRDVQKDIEENTNAVKEIVEEVKLWEDRATGLIAEDTKTKKSCFYGWCRNCIWQYRRGRDLAEKTQKIKALVENSNFAKIGRTAELPGLEYYSSPDFVHFDSRKLVYGKLLEALKNDESYKIALQGMGGSGKTTMVIDVGEKFEKEKLFDKVILVVVSNNPDVKKIQDEIARPLSLKFKQEENDLERAKKLWLRLTNGEKILIILDDVWKKLKFEDIGIPLDHNHKGCRVLLTTRDLSVCRLMECQGSTVQLKILSENEAWIFFQKHSSINDNSSKKLKDTAEKIAKECKGLPVALAAVASTLKNQPLEDWNAALKSLSNPRPIDITDHELKKVYKSLKVSYDFLNNVHAQELFKLCSLFPEDYEIPLEDLTRFAIGLGLFGEIDSYGTARDDVHRAKKRLIESCLLMEANEGRYVKMHDLVRDVAKLIANNEIQLIVGPKWNLANIEKQKTLRYLYCQKMIDFLEQLPCPKLEILLVSIDESGSLEVPEEFFKGMIDLKVLALWRSDWSGQSNLKLPRSIELLEGLRTLHLTNSKFEEISILKKLRRLETLELIRCFINELPNGIMELDKLRLLKLEGCQIEGNPVKVIGRLFQIEELHFVGNFGPNWEFTGGLVADLFDKDNISPKLQRYRISLENPPDRYGRFSITNSVSKGVGIEQFLIESISNTTIKHMIQRAEYLGLKKIQGGYKSVIPALVEAIGGDMNELTELVLDTYSGMEYLIDTTGLPSLIGTIFSKLIKLQLKEMCDLKELCHGHQTPPDLFEKLQSLEIHGCNKLRSRLLVRNLNLRRLEKLDVGDCPKLTSLFTFSTAQSLVELKQLRITGCKELKYIITEDREEGEEIVQDQNEDCPKARQHGNNTSSIITDGGDYQNHKNNNFIFPKLEKIVVENCSVLEFIFPASFSGNLPHLKSISIKAAPELKYVFGQFHREDNLSHQNDNLKIQIHLPALESITLGNLPKIISICPNNFYATWLSLKSVICFNVSITSISDFMVPYDTMQQDHIITEGLQISNSQQLCSSQYILRQSSSFCNIIDMDISGCPKLTSLFTLSVASTIMLEELTIRDCHGMKQIITDGGDYQNHKNNSSIFPKLKWLIVDSCSVLEFIFPVSFSGNLLQLQFIYIQTAPELKYVFGQYHHGDNLSHPIDNLEIQIDLPALESLHLIDLPEIISICPNNFYASWLPLKSSTLKKCPLLSITSISDFMIHNDTRQLDHITPKDLGVIVKHLRSLEEVSVIEQPKIEGILHLESFPMNEQYVTSKLSYLKLFNLLELRYIFKGPKYFLSLQNLRQIKIWGCGKLKAVFSISILRSLPQLGYLQIEDCKELEQIIEQDNEENQNLSNPQYQSVCFPQLSALIVLRCHKFKRLFTFCEFPKLELLLIKEASKLEQVFGFEQCENTQPHVSAVLPKLKYLILMKLPTLGNVYQGIDFLTIEYRVVHDCPKFNLPSTITTEDLVQHFKDEGIQIGGLRPGQLRSIFNQMIESLEDSKLKENPSENPTLDTTSHLQNDHKSEVEAALVCEPPSSQSQWIKETDDHKAEKVVVATSTDSKQGNPLTGPLDKTKELSPKRIKETVGQCAEEDRKLEKAVVATTSSTDSKSRNPFTGPLVKTIELSLQIQKEIDKEIVQKYPASEELAMATSPTPSQEIEIEIPQETNTIKQTMDQEGSKLENAMLKELSPQELAKKESMYETISKDQQGLGEMRSEIHSNDSKNDKQNKVELVQEESRKYTTMTEQQASIKENVQGDSTPEKDKMVTSSSHSEPQNTASELLVTSTQVIKETEKKNLKEYSASEKPAMATSSNPSLSPSAASSNEVIEATTVTPSTASKPRKPSAERLVFPQVHASATTASTRTDREILLIESKQNCADGEAIAQSKDTQEERTLTQVSESRTTEESVTEESTQIEDNMEAFYASIEADSSALPLAEDTSTNIEPVNVRPSEETQKALQILHDLVSKKFSLLLHPGRTGFMKNVLDYLLSLSPDDGISVRMKFVLLQLSKSFCQWSLDYSDASFKLESATANLSSIVKLEEGLEANVKEFREAETLENGACSKLAYLEGRKRELEDEINAIKGEIADCKLVRDTASERKRQVFDSGRMLKSQKDDLKNRVPRLKDEQEWAKLTQANIESEWSKLAHQFIESSSFGE